MRDSSRESVGTDRGMKYAGRGGPIFGLRFHVINSPWRLGPVWAVLAGAFAGQTPVWGGENLLRLGVCLLLADAAWGGLWRPTSPRQDVRPKARPRASLPYGDSHSPLTDLIAGLRSGATRGGETGWQDTIAALGLTVGLSLLLGAPARMLSVLVLAASIAFRLISRRGKSSALAMALLDTALPWALGATMGWTRGMQPSHGPLGGALILGLAFAMLSWSAHRVELSQPGGIVGPIWLGQFVVLAALVAVREPSALALASAFFVVPCLWLFRCSCQPLDAAEALRNSDLWWLVSMLVTALAVR